MIRVFRLILFLPFAVIGANAQMPVHVGVDAGVPVTDTLSSYSSSSLYGDDYSLNRFHSETKRLSIGPSLRLDLAKGLGLEFDALYQRVDYDSTSISTVPAVGYSYWSFEQVASNRWQFPLLVQYSHSASKLKPFVEAGPAISTIGNSKGASNTTSTINSVTTTSTNTAISGGRNTMAGITVGGGVDIPVFHTHLRPEFRYSHWFSSTAGLAIPGIAVNAFFLLGDFSSPSSRVAQNEASFLLGVSF